ALLLQARSRRELGPPALGAALEDVGVVEEPIEHRRGRCRIAEELAPVVDRSIRGEQRAGTLVAAHHDLEQIFGGGGRELSHPQVIQQEEWDGAHRSEVRLARSIECGVGKLFEQYVGLTVRDLVSLLDGCKAKGLGQEALARARRAKQKDVLVLLHEACGGELEDEATVRLRVEGEVKAIERGPGIPE